ncbi:hypothetical protein GSI01S_01_03170 [Gordonia sihwensis NBRC 108236]|uniref:Peptidase M15C domain-containing protein n=2 Tax=Gordonia sihwensis TaxID=173559 RepID=L7LDY8_9ACTN|nr:hypothetical protein GSI01S_01_03170 [Gordonia sihwensis NBRC 108236]
MSFRTVYGYSTSEAGWRMCNRDECGLVTIPDLYYVDTAPIRKGAPLTILGAWLYWYDRNVEEIVSPVWGWSATNDVANSNHLSGTAVDVNAPRYPWGSRTMPAAKKAKVREGLRLFEGLVFWGADWDRADEMHYQMGVAEGDQRAAAFAAKLRGGYLGIYKSAPPAPKPVPNMIDECARRHPEIGARLHTGERICKDGVGRYAEFAGGRIYWHPRTGAHVIPAGPIGEAFDKRGYEWNLGYPEWEANRALRDGGQCQAFEKGVLYTYSGGPVEGALIHGKIGDRWAREGWEGGRLGYPLGDEQPTADGGRRQEFEHGAMLWHPSEAIEILAAR